MAVILIFLTSLYFEVLDNRIKVSRTGNVKKVFNPGTEKH